MIKELWSGERYTTDELNARLKFFIGIILGLTLFGIVFVVLYSLIFVTQPMNGMSPVDNKFFELIIPVATFLTGTLSAIMLAGDDKDLRAKALDAANKPYTPPPSTPMPVAQRKEPSIEPLSAPLTAAPFTGTLVSSEAIDSVLNNFTPQISDGFGGKAAPVQPPHPEI
jgi:Na+-transporting methylmalonyl-CoA/oxaloacetate decarboxylase gamma subunit